MIDEDLYARVEKAGLIADFNGDVRGYWGPTSTDETPDIWRGYDGIWRTLGADLIEVVHASESAAVRAFLDSKA